MRRRRRWWWWRGAATELDVDVYVHHDLADNDHGGERDDVLNLDYDDGPRGCVVHGCLRVG